MTLLHNLGLLVTFCMKIIPGTIIMRSLGVVISGKSTIMD